MKTYTEICQETGVPIRIIQAPDSVIELAGGIKTFRSRLKRPIITREFLPSDTQTFDGFTVTTTPIVTLSEADVIFG